LPVLGDGSEREHTSTVHGADVPVARVFAPNFDLSFAESAKQLRADVVAAFAARWVRTRDEEHRRRPRDDQMSRMRHLDRGHVGSPFRDVDAARDEVGGHIAEAWGIVLSTTPFGKSLRCLSSTTDHL
jgi:hypothetical protein